MLEVSYAPGYEPIPDVYADAAPLRVDLLIAYDADTLAAAGAKSGDPVGYIDGQCKALVETSNLMLVQSNASAFVWRYLGAVSSPAYTRTGKTLDDIQAMAPGGAIADWVWSVRYQRGADQILLMIGGDVDFGGRAYSPKQKAVTRDLAVSVLMWGSSYRMFAHELAHNFGCQHDRAHETVISYGEYGPPAPDNDGFWCYGQMWDNPAIPGGANSGTSGTIMSYADFPIPYYSNPNITVHVTGFLAGWSWDPDLGTHQIGRAETDPKAAYNVRVLNEQATAMSNISEEIGMPTILVQPASVTVAKGSYFSLTATTAGGGLTYQWKKDGADISGAVTASYSKFSSDSDAGSYRVVVSNLAGTATSAEAIVTVTNPPPPPATSGGGGGALDLWFCGMLWLCGFIQWFCATRRSP